MRLLIVLSCLIICFLLSSGCSSCSRTGRERAKLKEGNRGEARRDKTIVKMVKKSGVYQIPIEINGTPMTFIFDTGASIVSISLLEAEFLFKQGKIKEEDVIGTQQFIDANGDMVKGC